MTYLNARVYNREGELGIDFDHLALLIHAPNETALWLADVGFGDSFNLPLNFEERGEQVQGLRAYRVEQTRWRITSPGKKITMAHGSVNISLIFSRANFQSTTNLPVPITRPRLNQASHVEALSAEQPQMDGFHLKMDD